MTTETYIDASCISRMSITIARIQVQECGHPVYGQGGCTATRAEPCDHVLETCPSRCDFICKNVDYVHTDCKTSQVGNSYEPDVVDFPDYGLGSVEFCKGLPQSGTISLTLQDSPGCDYPDRYRNTRPSGPDNDGYRLARFEQKHDLEGRLLEVGIGYCGQPYPSSFFNARYYIDSFTGPNGRECRWTIVAKDALSLLANSASQYPSNNDITKLSSDYVQGEFTDLTLLLQDNLGDQFGDERIICLKGEAMRVEYRGQTQLFNHFYLIKEREMCGSTRITDTVEAGEDVYFAAYWPKGTNIADVYLDLLTKGAGLPVEDQACDCGPYESCIVDVESFAEWADTCGKLYVIPETIICKPTGLRELFDELAIFGVMPYLDDCDQKIKLHHYRPTWCDPHQDLPVFYENDLINCRVDVTPKPAERYTSVDIRGNPADCTKGVDDSNLVLLGRMQGLAGVGDVCGNPNWLPPKNRSLKSRFLGGCNAYLGPRLAQRIWYARRKKVKQIRFRVHASRLPVNLRKTSFFMLRHKKLETKRVPPAVYWLTRLRPVRGNCWEITAMTSGFDASQRWKSQVKTCEGECAHTIAEPRQCDADYDVGCALTY